MGAGSVPAAAAARDGEALGERAGGARPARRRPLGSLAEGRGGQRGRLSGLGCTFLLSALSGAGGPFRPTRAVRPWSAVPPLSGSGPAPLGLHAAGPALGAEAFRGRVRVRWRCRSCSSSCGPVRGARGLRSVRPL